MNRKNRRQLWLPVLSGVLLAFAFEPFNFWWLGFIALVPLLAYLRRASSFYRAFVGSLLGGVTFFGVLLGWLLSLNDFTAWAYGAYGATILYSALFWGLFGGLTCYFRQHFKAYFWLIPFLWVFAESLRAFGDLAFTWGGLGYVLTAKPLLLQFADLFGSIGISFWLMAVNTFLCYGFLFFKRRHYWATALVGLVLLTPVFYSWHQWDRWGIPTGNLRVSVVQGNIAQNEKWSSQTGFQQFQKLMNLSDQALQHDPDLLIWPEASLNYFLMDVDSYEQDLLRLAKQEDVAVLAGYLRPADTDKPHADYFNSATLFKPDGEVVFYNKRKLVAVTEKFPLRSWLPSILQDFLTTSPWVGRTAEGDRSALMHVKDRSFGNLICYESGFADLSRDYKIKGADFLVNITNDAWFGKSQAAAQHADFLKLRAIENRLPIVRVANTGITGWVSLRGKYIDQTGLFTEAVRTYDIPFHATETFYARYGYLFKWLTWILVIGFSFYKPLIRAFTRFFR